MQKNLSQLKEFLLRCEKVAIAYSGGMDSSFLALMAQKNIPGKYVALLVNSSFMTESELNIARATAKKYNLNLREIRVEVLDNVLITANSDLRCYHCKKEIFKYLLEEAKGATLCDGSVVDDAEDYRPGKKALAELGVASPLAECNFDKKMIAQGLEALGASELARTAQSCLATRIVTGDAITATKLKQIEQGEILLHSAGLDYFRLRHHGEIARIETAPEQRHDSLDKITKISSKLKSLGFKHVALDVDGYIKGSMNRMNPQDGNSKI